MQVNNSQPYCGCRNLSLIVVSGAVLAAGAVVMPIILKASAFICGLSGVSGFALGFVLANIKYFVCRPRHVDINFF